MCGGIGAGRPACPERDVSTLAPPCPDLPPPPKLAPRSQAQRARESPRAASRARRGFVPRPSASEPPGAPGSGGKRLSSGSPGATARQPRALGLGAKLALLFSGSCNRANTAVSAEVLVLGNPLRGPCARSHRAPRLSGGAHVPAGEPLPWCRESSRGVESLRAPRTPTHHGGASPPHTVLFPSSVLAHPERHPRRSLKSRDEAIRRGALSFISFFLLWNHLGGHRAPLCGRDQQQGRVDTCVPPRRPFWKDVITVGC